MRHHTIDETAERLRVSRRTIERYIAAGRLRTVRLSQRQLGVTAESLREMLGTAQYLRLFRGDRIADAYETLQEAADALAPIHPDLAQRVAQAVETLLDGG